MFWADTVGLSKVLGTIERIGRDHDYWEPAPLLARLAREGRGFGDLDKGGDNG
jgi:3-hydroxyacyl-CoA dehydrogenase